LLGSIQSIFSGSREALGPRKIKGLFNVSTTSSKEPPAVLEEVERVLKANNYDTRIKGFVVKARSLPEAAVKKPLAINFEVCVTANLDLTGIRLTRVKGDMWEYKQTVDKLLAQMKL
jgi:hypothetical protein